MARRIGKGWWLLAMSAVVLALLIYAWIDGGRRPLREISESVALPGGAA